MKRTPALRRFARATALSCALSAVGAGAGPAAAQAPLFLEPAHWSGEALRRFAVMGLLPPAADPAMAPLTVQHVRASLAAAAVAADETGQHARALLARSYVERLDAESDTAGPLAALRVAGGWLAASGEGLAGDGYFREEDWQGVQPLADLGGAAAVVEAGGFLHPRISWTLAAGRVEDRWAVPAATLATTLGPFDVWGGRRRLHYGVGRGGGTVIGAGTAESAGLALRTHYSFDGLGIHVREPFHFPGFLRILGPARIEAAGGRLARNGNVAEPYVVFGRLIGHPISPRITLGINRGAIFGGEGNPITLSRLGGLLVGLHGGEGGEFENQVFSTIVRYRPPLGPLPVELFVEWGMDDTAGAVRDTPGIVAGLDVAALPGLPQLSLGIERTSFPQSCCGNPIWYRSVFFRGSWADEGRLLAHPLAGHGTEWLGHAALDLPQQRLLVRARTFVRDRGDENLFAPGREGRSVGAAAAVDFGVTYATRLLLNGSFEDGVDWSTQRITIMISHSLLPRTR